MTTMTTATINTPNAPSDVRAHLVGPGSGLTYATPDGLPLPAFEIKLDGVLGAPFSIMEYVVPAGFAPPPVLHRHTREFGAVYVLEGELTYWFEDRTAHRATPGSLVVMARDWFRWANEQSRPAKLLCIFSPAGFEQFFVGIHDRMKAADYDLAQLGTIIMDQRVRFGDEAHRTPVG